MTPLETPQATAYAETHRQSQTEAHAVAVELSELQFNWKPGPAVWSVGECLAHLNIVADAYLPRLEAAIAGDARRGEGPFEHGFVARKMRGAVVPGGPALKTGRTLNPSDGRARSSLERTGVLASFDARVSRYVAVCEGSAGLDLAQIKVRYPFMRLLRLPLGAFLDTTGLHALRHVQQARRVVDAPGFPV